MIAVMLIIMHFAQKQQKFMFGFDKFLIKPLLKSAWPMILSAVATMLYMRIDQIMIKNMIGVHEFGLYSAASKASKIYEGWIILPIVLSIAILPLNVKMKDGCQIAYKKI